MKKNYLPLLLLVPGGLWGLSFLATEFVLETIPPITLGLGRSILAGIPLVIALYWMGGRLPRTWNGWVPYIILGLLNNSLPLTLISWGQLTITSGLTTILVSLNPLFTLLLAHYFIDDERLNRQKSIGILLGLLGVVVLVGPSVLSGLGQEVWAQLAIVGGALSYAIASIYARLHLRQQHDQIWRSIVKLMGSQYIASAVMLIPLSLWIDQSYQLQPSLRSLSGILALAWPLTLAPVVIYYYLIDQAGSSYTSLTVYLIPLVGIFAGFLILDEIVTPQAVIALVLILFGMAVVNNLGATVRRWAKGEQAVG